MTDLPAGWEWTTLGEIADTTLGKMLERGRSNGHPHVPYLRNVNVQWGHIDLTDVNTMELAVDRHEEFALREGDLLVCEGGEVGRCAIYQGGSDYMAFQKALHRVRPRAGVDGRFLRYLLEYYGDTGTLETFVTGSTIKHLPQIQLRRLPVPLPPLAEQHRIVASLEESFSRIDGGFAGLNAALRRTRALVKHVLIAALPSSTPPGWTTTTVARAGDVSLGRQRHPDWHSGDHMRPYLRVANVFEDRIDTSDVMEMDFLPDVFDRFRLVSGDILLNEGQSPEYLGRPAMYRGEPARIAFTNSLIRFRAGPGIDPEWALLVFRRHLHAGRFAQEVRITTNIAHLSAGRFKAVEFPVPPLDEQKRIVSAVKGSLDSVSRFIENIELSRMRAGLLRRSLMSAAFAGRLVPQDPDDELASALLDRIRAERDNIEPTARKRRAPTPSASRPKRGGAGGR